MKWRPQPSQHPIAVMLRHLEAAANCMRGVEIVHEFERDFLMSRCDDVKRAIAVAMRPPRSD